MLALLVLSPLAAGQYSMRPAPDDGADDARATPPALRGLEIEQLIGNPLPMELPLTDSQGRATTLKSVFEAGKPVLLNLGYFECPMLCPLVHAGIVDAAKQVDWAVGEDYLIVSVSIDHEESPGVARDAKRKVLAQLNQEGAEAGWHFLVADAPVVEQVTAAAGYGYRYVPGQDEYAHGSVIVFVTPDGVVNSYLNGTRYNPQQFELSLVDAAQGQAGSPFEQFIAWCYQFSSHEGKYVIMAQRVMMMFGALMILALGGTIGGLFWWERRRRGGSAKQLGMTPA